LLRSSLGRYDYAAFQSATAILLYLKLTPPDGEEGWSHAATPHLLKERLESVMRSRDERRRAASYLSELYKLRLEADYIGEATVNAAKLKASARKARYLVKVMEEVLT